MSEAPTSGTPLVLLINDEEWTTRSMQSILAPEGYAVLTAFTGRQGLELAAKVRPEVLLVDYQLPDFNGIDLCAELRRLPTIRPSTPILLFTSGVASRRERLAAFRAGAWDVLDPPFDPQELLARLTPLIQAKRDTDLALEASYLDPLTGFYNVNGLMRRLTEIEADTKRYQRDLACVVVGPADGAHGSGHERDSAQPETFLGPPDLAQRIAAILLEVTRLSDAVARVGTNDFVIVAPGTDEHGAHRLAERVMEVVDRSSTEHGGVRKLNLRAGYYAVPGAKSAALIAEEILRRAKSALRTARVGADPESESDRIVLFYPN